MARTVRTLFEFATKAQTGGIMAVRNELEGVTNDVSEFGNRAEDASGKAGRAEQSIGALGKAANTAKKLIAGLSLAGIGALSTAVGTVGRDVIATMDDMSLFQAQTGVSTEALLGYEEAARRVFELGLGDSFGDVASTMAQVRAATGLEGDELEYMTNQALRFQQVFGVDTPESIRAVNTLMSTFGVDAGRAWDMVIAAQQNGAGYAGDFADSIAEYSENYRALGFDVQQFMSMNAQASELGLRNTDVLNDSMREFGIRLNDGTSAQALYNLGLGRQLQLYQQGKIDGRQMFMAVQDALNATENDARRMDLGAQIFGTKWEDETSTALLSLDLITTDMMNVTGAGERMAEAMNEGPSMAWRQFTRALQGSMRDALGPYITKVLNSVIPVLKWFTRETPQLVAFGGALAGISAVLLPVMAVISTAAPALTMLGGAAAVAAGPLLLLAGAVAAFGLAYKNNWLGIHDKIDKLPDSFKKWTGIDLSNLKANLEAAFAEFKADPKTFINNLKADIEAGVSELEIDFSQFKSKTQDRIKKAVTGLETGAADFAANLKTDIEEKIAGLSLDLSALKTDIETTLSGLRVDVSGLSTGLAGEINALELGAADLDMTLIGTDVANRLLDVILVALPIVFGGPAGLAIGAAKLVAMAFNTDFLGFRTALEETGIVTAIEDGAAWVWDTLTGFFKSDGEGGGGPDTSALTTVIDTIKTTVQPLIDWLGELGGNIEPGLTAIKDGIVGFIDSFKTVETEGIENALGTIVEIIGGVIGGLIISLKPIIEAGSVFVGGMLQSIGNWLPKLGEVISGLITTISRALDGDMTGAAESFVGALGSLISGAAGLAGDGIQAALDTLSALVTGFGDLVGVDLSGVGTAISGLPQTIAEAASGVEESVKTWITDKFKGAVDKVAHYFSNGGFDTLGGKLAKMITGLPEWLTDLPGAILNSITSKFSDAVSSIWDWFVGEQEGSLKSKLMSLPGEIEAALVGIGDAIKNKLVNPALEKLQPLIDGFDWIVDGIGKIGGWLGIGGDDGGSGGGGTYPDPQDVDGTVEAELADTGGRALAGQPRLIGTGVQPELFIPETNGRFYIPKPQYSLAPAGAGANGGPVTVHQWAGATLHFEGVQDIDDLYRQITDLERRKNIKPRRA